MTATHAGFHTQPSGSRVRLAVLADVTTRAPQRKAGEWCSSFDNDWARTRST